MSVYVDNAKIKYRRMKMCHMIADTLPELHEMADKIGVARCWFQDKKIPHYDICQAKRQLAVTNGAIETARKGIVAVLRRLRVNLKKDNGGKK